MEDMGKINIVKDMVIVFLEANTDSKNIWSNLRDLYLSITPSVISHTNGSYFDAEKLLINTISHMVMEGDIRMDQRSETEIIIALEQNIQNVLNKVKKSAIEEMEEELEKYVKEEDYEKAAEYRDMINEYKSKINS